MSFYRSLIAAVATLGLASAVFAADAAKTDQPAAAASTVASASKATTAVPAEKVNLNKATAKELAAVKGITKAKAHAIVAFRKKNGDFKSVEDLKQVAGFKRMKEEAIKEIEDQLTV